MAAAHAYLPLIYQTSTTSKGGYFFHGWTADRYCMYVRPSMYLTSYFRMDGKAITASPVCTRVHSSVLLRARRKCEEGSKNIHPNHSPDELDTPSQAIQSRTDGYYIHGCRCTRCTRTAYFCKERPRFSVSQETAPPTSSFGGAALPLTSRSYLHSSFPSLLARL